MPSYGISKFCKKLRNSTGRNSRNCTMPHCVNHGIQFIAGSRHFPITFLQLARDWLNDLKYLAWPSTCQELVPNLLAIPLLYSYLIVGLRHEVLNLQSIIFSLSIAIS